MSCAEHRTAALGGYSTGASAPNVLANISGFAEFRDILENSSFEGWQALGKDENFKLAMQGVEAAGYAPTDFHDFVHDIMELGVPEFLKAMPSTVGPRVLAKTKQLLVCISEHTTVALASRPNPMQSTISNAVNLSGPVSNCSVSLQRGEGDYSTMMRCAIRGHLQNNVVGKRRKVLTAVLDNSGSMRDAWPLVVEAITRVFTDDLLQDPLVSLNAIAYNTNASEVVIPPRSTELSNLLLQRFAPGGITNFQSAFELAEQMIQRDVSRFIDAGIPSSAIDVTTLLFTDGEDTSVPPHGSKSNAATAKARAAGDKFRRFLGQIGCAAYTCIAAFGQQHNPEQCQYLSDRYFYINRREVLSEWLSGGLSELLESAGHCSLQFQLPAGISLAEPIPPSIGVDAEGRVEYEAWLVCDTIDCDCPASIEVTVEDSGSITLTGSAKVSSATLVDARNFDGHLFVLDAAEMQLRQIARELRGRRPTKPELALLRERLVGVKVLAQPVADAASNIKLQLRGRALLLARLEELETRRNRLSYALGHFEEGAQDTRHIGAVGIDAILRDASQKVPLSAQTLTLSRGAEAAAALAEPEQLSTYGQQFTTLAFSQCDARAVASVGDAGFFLSKGLACNGGLISYDVFSVLSHGGARPVEFEGETFTHVGIPLYCSEGHFQRARLLLPNVLLSLTGDHVYKAGVSEKCLLTLLANALVAHLDMPKQRPDLSLFHQARSVEAVFEVTITPSGKTMIDDVLADGMSFIEDKSYRRSANLFNMVAIGLLAQRWPASRVKRLAELIVEESIQRAALPKLQQMTDSEKFRLAWALLGPPKEEKWLRETLTDTSASPEIDGFSVLAAVEELESLHQSFPQACAPRHARLLPWLLSTTNRTDPSCRQWVSMRRLLTEWSSLVENHALHGVWKVLDEIMLRDDGQLGNVEQFAAVLRSDDKTLFASVGEALVVPMESVKAIAEECVRHVSRPKGLKPDESTRKVLAAVLRSVVAERTAIAQKYAIRNAEYPSSSGKAHAISSQRMQQMWGTCALPVNKEMHDQARRDTHQKYNALPLVVKEALSDKAYRERGGRFKFPTQVDTFIPGLHRRTKDLHAHWDKHGKSAGTEACKAAVDELLLRLPWDDEDECARRKLTKILTNIWTGLEDSSFVCDGISSALWLDDDKEGDISSINVESTRSDSSSNDDDWKCV